MTLLVALALMILPVQADESPGAGTAHFETQTALEEFRALYGERWRLTMNWETVRGRHLFGGALDSAVAGLSTPVSDADFVGMTRMHMAALSGIFAVDIATLDSSTATVAFLPLSRAGSTDKMAVTLLQDVAGVPVVMGASQASLHAVYDMGGRLLSMDSRCLPGAERVPLSPMAASDDAVLAAVTQFAEDTGLMPGEVGIPELVIVSHLENKVRVGRLAWSVALMARPVGAQPLGRRMFMAADVRRPGLLEYQELVHNHRVDPVADLTGTVSAWATPGTEADHSGNPEQVFAMPAMTVTSSAGNATTDAAGNFVISNAGTSTVNVTARFEGTWATVSNQAGSNYTLSASLTPGTPGSFMMNPGKTEAITAQANTFLHLNRFREFVVGINSSDTTMDFQALGKPNIDSSCNAYYDGSSTNYYNKAGSCNNTAFSNVVYHEQGHWANDRYGSGNGWDGFGEGNADVYAMYISDNPIVGEYFFTNGGAIRTGENTRQWCGQGCYGQVHTDGEVLMGALWKVRKHLNTALGNDAGDLVADSLFSAWMNAYNDGSILPVIEDHWLVLDDTDGNIGNGTPHFSEINQGFLDQGFPGIELDLISIQHVPLASTTDEIGPYVVDAVIQSQVGETITAARVYWSTDGGASFVWSPMAPGAGQNNWVGQIPGQVSPATVAYYLWASDTQQNVHLSPDGAPGAYWAFNVGVTTVLFSDGFEGSNDNGWIHQQVSTQDDWQRGIPQGKAGDPSAAYAGSNVWANDLGQVIGGTTWNGEYKPDVHNWLEAPPFDASGLSNVRLRFRRWLQVEEAIYDQAQILVNGTKVWENPMNGHLLDPDWVPFEIDVSQWAAGNPSVAVRFRLLTDGGLEFGGWNIDEYEVLSLEPSPACPDPVAYGSGTPGMGGSTPALGSSGTAQLNSTDFVLEVVQGLAFAPGVLVVGTQQADLPFMGGSLLVLSGGQPILIPVAADASGMAVLPVPIPGTAALADQHVYCQALFLDSGAVLGVSMTQGLDVLICP